MTLQSWGAASPRHGGPRSFQVRIDLVGCRVDLAGQLDRRTVHLLQAAISTLLLTDGDTWVVDATDVTACDPVGIRGIGAAYRRALRHDRRLRVTGAPPFLHEELIRLRLDHHLLDGDRAATVPSPLPV
ncbi:anti-anti-sigma regulatory factor [Geodermatophilus normandii]|uniref:Anti-anti-sigma regulatory factor n=1 Tax=Geodermatophilus normandii TaxID=1137989 RepID=A0A317QFU4_9ACTN|nr:STAS domain-containing protein [Geodermatophilus normandii]PWW22558.1 anti-anti-sigma regulatory factor [Geodermatophilus normandii]